MGVILLKIQREMPALGSASHHRMRGIERCLEQLMRHRGLRNIRSSYGTRDATFSHVKIREKHGINYPKSKPHFFLLGQKGENQGFEGLL